MLCKESLLTIAIVAVSMALSFVAPALAGTGGGGLPWEGPLQQIQESINGPVAGAIALAAMAIAGGMLIFGGELNDFARRLVYIVSSPAYCLARPRSSACSEQAALRLALQKVTAKQGRGLMAEFLSSLRRNRIHRALSRPNLLMGADRELVLLTGLAAVILIFVVLTVYSALVGVAIWIFIVGVLSE